MTNEKEKRDKLFGYFLIAIQEQNKVNIYFFLASSCM